MASDDIFGEERRVNYTSLILTGLLLIVILILALHFTGHLGGGGSTPTSAGSNNGTSSNSAMSSQPVNETELNKIRNATTKVFLVKYIVYKDRTGEILGVAGYFAVKTEYYKGFMNDFILSVQNVPADKINVYYKLYSKDYKGYVIVYFAITPRGLYNFKTKTLNLLVMFRNIPYHFTIDFTKHILLVNAPYKVVLQYNVPKVATTPVMITTTFQVFSRYPLKTHAIIQYLETHYRESSITMTGEVQYYMHPIKYTAGENYVSITYLSPASVVSGVYTLKYSYVFMGQTITKIIGTILVNNTASQNPLISVGIYKKNGKIPLTQNDEMILVVKNSQAQMALPVFRITYYTGSLEKVATINMDGKIIGFGTNMINVPVPSPVLNSNNVYYMVILMQTPNGNQYSYILKFNSGDFTKSTQENSIVNGIEYLVYPVEDYAYDQSAMSFYALNITKTTIKVPIIVFYSSKNSSINVVVKTQDGTSQTVTLHRYLYYQVQGGNVPLFVGSVTLKNVPVQPNYFITVKFPDGNSVKASIHVNDIYYNGAYLNNLLGETVVSNPPQGMTHYTCTALNAYLIYADYKSIDTGVTVNTALNNILMTRIILTPKDVAVKQNKVIININNGTARKLLYLNWVNYQPYIQTLVNNLKVIVRQNLNPALYTITTANAKYVNGSIVINLPYLSSERYVYISFQNYVIPLNWFRLPPQPSSASFNYDVYTYIPSNVPVKTVDDFAVLMNSIINDNSLAYAVLFTKLNYDMKFEPYIMNMQQQSNSTNETQTYTNPPMNYTNSTSYGSVVFVVGSAQKPANVELLVNGVALKPIVKSYRLYDFYVNYIMVPQSIFMNAINGLGLIDIISGRTIITLKIDDVTLYNIFPFTYGYMQFFISGKYAFVTMQPGDSSLLRCNGNPLPRVLDVRKSAVEYVVYDWPESGCVPYVKSDLYGNVPIIPSSG